MKIPDISLVQETNLLLLTLVELESVSEGLKPASIGTSITFLFLAIPEATPQDLYSVFCTYVEILFYNLSRPSSYLTGSITIKLHGLTRPMCDIKWRLDMEEPRKPLMHQATCQMSLISMVFQESTPGKYICLILMLR